MSTPGAVHEELDDAEVVVVAYRSRTNVEALLAALPAHLPLAVVDNSDGTDGLRELVEARPNGRYLAGGGVGFARAANLGARTSSAQVLLFVKPTVRPSSADLATLVADVTGDPNCSASAATLLNEDGSTQMGTAGWEPSFRRALVHAAGLHKLFPRAGIFARPELGRALEVDWVNGGCMAVRRETFERLGCFDEDFHVFNEDVAFGRESRARGMVQQLRTDVGVRQAAGGSGAPALDMWRLRGASMARYLRKHHSRVAADLMVAVLGAGYLVRVVTRVLARDLEEARVHWAYTRGVVSGRATMAGRPVYAHP
ncbi:hypothetical protein JOD57_002862 [Geodermatophilus bullaregiensis]|uniref:glycosyltransferase n=1 Tax=Geodermatophilus bullaregiensis TaxID=1564160 RepID=UPI00195B303D|nr:glycosyltransferase [Geodermatophilus bullaregiensis]MBM7807025.1 hypothetical protein [Geodermatophilus bullaregiensis]